MIGLGFLVLGFVLMVIWRAAGHAEFFRRRPEPAAADALGVQRTITLPEPAMISPPSFEALAKQTTR
jgi:hypothetical protein